MGYTNIPTDGTGRILITDIGEGNSAALICVTDVPGASGSDWYLHPTSSSTDSADRIDSPDPRGWLRNRDTDIYGFPLIRLRRDVSETSVGGVFTCDISVDTGTPISVGIYYASEAHFIV